MTLGSKIQTLRKNKGMSQEDLSNLLNVSRQAVQKWENDSSVPEIDKIIQISNIFDVSLDYLLKDKPNEEKTPNNLESIEKEESIPASTIVKYEENGMEEGRIRACKVWLIIGTVLTPLSAGGSFLGSVQSLFALLFLLLYAVTIPLCVFAIKAIKTAKNKNDVIGWGVISLLFVSLIGGVLILSARFKTKIVESANNTVISNSSVYVSSEASNEFNLEESKYSKLQQLIYDYETTEKLSSLREIVTISSFLAKKDYKDSVQIKEKYAPILDKKDKEADAKLRKGLKVGGIIALIAVVLTAIIVPVSIASANNAKKKKYDETYSRVMNLLENYDDSNYYIIDGLIDDLYRSDYDISTIRKMFMGRHNYALTVEYISNFKKQRRYSLTNIKTYMDKAENGYKLINSIRNDYEKVENYVSTMSWNSSSSYSDEYTSDSAAEKNRNAISYIYSYANTSGLWNFDYLVKDVAIPYLVCGMQFSYNSYYFKWYKDSSGGHLTWSVPTPSSYDPSTAYYFDTSFTGSGYKSSNTSSEDRYTNQLRFYLKPQTGTSYTIDMFRIDEISYQKSSGRFACKVYLFGNGSTVTFTQD